MYTQIEDDVDKIALDSLKKRHLVKVVLVLIICVILIVDVAKLVNAIMCDHDSVENEKMCNNFPEDLADVKEMMEFQPFWFGVEVSMIVLYFAHALILLPFIFISMQRLKAIDIDFHNNSRRGIYISSALFSVFLIFHEVMYYLNKLIQFKIITEKD